MMTRHGTTVLLIRVFVCIALAAWGCDMARAATFQIAPVASFVMGQKSLLDMEEEPANSPPPPPKKIPPSNAAPNSNANQPSAGASVDQPATVPNGPPTALSLGSLDDLLSDGPDSSPKNENIEVERVCDFVVQKSQTVPIPVRLLVERLQPPLSANDEYEFVRLSGTAKQQENRKRDWKFTVRGDDVYSIIYYEDRMLSRAAAAFGISQAELVDSPTPISLAHPEMLRRARAAISVLNVALTEHESARSRLQRQGPTWDPIRDQLSKALLNLQLAQVELIVSRANTQNSIAALDRMRTSPAIGTAGQARIQRRLEELFLDPAAKSLAEGDYFAARTALDEILSRYPFDREAKSRQIREGLISAAKSFVDRARAENDPSWLEKAKNVWPQLAGLDEVRRQMVREYPVLHCAYATLPTHFSPLTAETAVDRHATSLLFESLVEWKFDERSVPHYSTMLATHRPLSQARGREFSLPHAQWSDSGDLEPHYCTAEDVRWTIELLRKCKPFTYPLAWQDLIDEVHSSDPFIVDIRLHRDYWQPLSLMDFPILPKSSFPSCAVDKAELVNFDQAPVGTGPYRKVSSASRDSVRFMANPLYHQPQLPKIREIIFHQLDAIEARDKFIRGDIQLIVGVRPTHVVELRQQGRRIEKVPAKNIYFLAPNHRRTLLRNRDLRLALAHAINREAILKTHFRPGNAGNDHAALNGPYLVNTWAYNPRVPAYTTTDAKVFLSNAMKSLGPINLTLIYPDRDPDVAAACGEIQRQWQAYGINLKIEPVNPDIYHQTVVQNQAFDLAYWRHDFKDEAYWLWPLFNPQDTGPGGTNFMGYVPNEDLQKLFARMRDHKMFRTVQQTAHEIHDLIHREAAIIPLWQLDSYVAVGDTVRDERFSPFQLFEDIQHWRLEAQ